MGRTGHLLVVIAHPDDESFGCGSTIAEAIHRGYTVSVCCASLGEEGEPAPGFDLAGRTLGEIRFGELQAAASVLGAQVLVPLGLTDSGWAGPAPADSICGIDEQDLVDRLAAVIKTERPDVVLTLAGDDGHRDHRRLAELMPQVLAGQPQIDHYQWCLPNALMRRWAAETTRLRPDTAHLALEIAQLSTPAARITAVLDTTAHLKLRREAIAAHASQTSPYEGLSAELTKAFLTADHLIRID